MTGCNDESKKKESGIPEKMTRNHGDSLALAARFTGDFEHFLAVTDSLTDAGELSQIRADGPEEGKKVKSKKIKGIWKQP